MKTPQRFKKMQAKHPGGWTDWVYPKNTYKFKCCDCGLVHDMQFAAFAETNQKRGNFEVHYLPWPIRAMFRARRAKP